MKTCPKCGAELSENAAFCGKCGAKIAREGSEAIVKPSAKQKVGKKAVIAIAAVACLLVVFFLTRKNPLTGQWLASTDDESAELTIERNGDFALDYIDVYYGECQFSGALEKEQGTYLLALDDVTLTMEGFDEELTYVQDEFGLDTTDEAIDFMFDELTDDLKANGLSAKQAKSLKKDIAISDTTIEIDFPADKLALIENIELDSELGYVLMGIDEVMATYNETIVEPGEDDQLNLNSPYEEDELVFARE